MKALVFYKQNGEIDNLSIYYSEKQLFDAWQKSDVMKISIGMARREGRRVEVLDGCTSHVVGDIFPVSFGPCNATDELEPEDFNDWVRRMKNER